VAVVLGNFPHMFDQFFKMSADILRSISKKQSGEHAHFFIIIIFLQSIEILGFAYRRLQRYEVIFAIDENKWDKIIFMLMLRKDI